MPRRRIRLLATQQTLRQATGRQTRTDSFHHDADAKCDACASQFGRRIVLVRFDVEASRGGATPARYHACKPALRLPSHSRLANLPCMRAPEASLVKATIER
eukprot:6214485-Pleurochrysis_carterae.AAC.4